MHTTSQTKSNDEYLLDKLCKYTDTNNDSILYYSNKLKKSKDSCYVFKALNFEAKALYQKGEIDSSERISKAVLNQIKNKEDDCYKKNKITSLSRLFWIYKNKNQFQKAFDVVIERCKIVEELNPKDDYYYANMLSTKNNLAIIKSILGLYSESREILQKTLPQLPIVYKNLENGDYFLKLNQSSTYNLIAETFLESTKDKNNKNLDSASYYFKKAYKVALTFTPQHQNTEILYQLREIEVLIARKKFNKALLELKKLNSSDYKITQNIYSLKAICFYNLNNGKSAIYFSRKFIQENNFKSSSKKRLTVVYDILANQYFKNKEIDSAYKYSELTIKELNLLSKSKNETSKSHYLYDFENSKELNNLILSKEKKKGSFFISILSISLTVLLIIFYFFYKRSKKIKSAFSKVKNKIEIDNNKQKTAYHLDDELHQEIVDGFEELKKNKEYLTVDFSIQKFAKELNTNTSYISYIVNKEKNKTFKQYITDLRIEYLIEKLKEDPKYRKYTIKYLAKEIGYTNASAFTRAFKKHQGITPSDFMKSLDID